MTEVKQSRGSIRRWASLTKAAVQEAEDAGARVGFRIGEGDLAILKGAAMSLGRVGCDAGPSRVDALNRVAHLAGILKALVALIENGDS